MSKKRIKPIPRTKENTLVKLKAKISPSHGRKSADAVQVNMDYSFTSDADGKTYAMTLKQKMFAEAYLQLGGVGSHAVLEVFTNVKDPKVAAVMAYDLLRLPHIIAYVNDKLEEYGFSDKGVEKQHLFLLNQHSDFQGKARAIDMFYKLSGKYAAEKRDIKGTLTVNTVQYGDNTTPQVPTT